MKQKNIEIFILLLINKHLFVKIEKVQSLLLNSGFKLLKKTKEVVMDAQLLLVVVKKCPYLDIKEETLTLSQPLLSRRQMEERIKSRKLPSRFRTKELLKVFTAFEIASMIKNPEHGENCLVRAVRFVQCKLPSCNSSQEPTKRGHLTDSKSISKADTKNKLKREAKKSIEVFIFLLINRHSSIKIEEVQSLLLNSGFKLLKKTKDAVMDTQLLLVVVKKCPYLDIKEETLTLSQPLLSRRQMEEKIKSRKLPSRFGTKQLLKMFSSFDIASLIGNGRSWKNCFEEATHLVQSIYSILEATNHKGELVQVHTKSKQKEQEILKRIEVYLLLLINKHSTVKIEEVQSLILNFGFTLSRKIEILVMNAQLLLDIVKKCPYLEIKEETLTLSLPLSSRREMEEKIKSRELPSRFGMKQLLKEFSSFDIASMVGNCVIWGNCLQHAVLFVLYKCSFYNSSHEGLGNKYLTETNSISKVTDHGDETIQLYTDYTLVNNSETLRIVKEELQNKIILSVDCEGVSLGRTGELCLVQISDGTNEYLFDPLVPDEDFVKELFHFLKHILENKNIIKIFHDCRQDSAALYYQFDILLANVVDTQILYKYIENTESNKEIGLNDLLGKYNLEFNYNKEKMKKLMKRDWYIWIKRPFSAIMLSYAALDVKNLILLYEAMMNQFDHNRMSELQYFCRKFVLWHMKEEIPEAKLLFERKKNKFASNRVDKLFVRMVSLNEVYGFSVIALFIFCI